MASFLLGYGAASLGDRCPTFRPLKMRSPRVLETSGTDDAVTLPHVPEGSELRPCESLNPLVTYISKIFSENSTGPLTTPCEAFSIFPQALCANGEQSFKTGIGQFKCDGTRAETRFRLSAKRTSPFISAGASVQSTTGSRGVRISASNAGYTTFRGSVKSTGYPLHSPVSPSLPFPCVTVCHHISSGVYNLSLPLFC